MKRKINLFLHYSSPPGIILNSFSCNLLYIKNILNPSMYMQAYALKIFTQIEHTKPIIVSLFKVYFIW